MHTRGLLIQEADVLDLLHREASHGFHFTIRIRENMAVIISFSEQRCNGNWLVFS